MDSSVNNHSFNSENRSSGSAGLWKILPGYAIALLCLLWVFHDVRFGGLLRSITDVNWWWVAGAVFLDVFSYGSQGLRWSLVLHPIGRISTLRSTQAIYAGLFVNEILPMRLGEVLRIYLVSRWISLRFSEVVPSILVERFFDAVWLTLAFGVTVLVVPLPKYLVSAEEILGFTALSATILFIYLVFHKSGDEPLQTGTSKAYLRPITSLLGFFENLGGGVRKIGRSKYFYSSFGVSLVLLLCQILSFWFVMLAYGLKLSIWHGAAVFLIVHVGTAIPSAPSNVGTYQFFAVAGLTLFGMDKTLATSFSVVAFLILTIPLWIIGMAVFGHLGLTLKGIKGEMSSLARNGIRPADAARRGGPVTK